MPDKFTALTTDLHRYLVDYGARQDETLERLAAETEELMGERAVMQIAPDQGALITLLVRAIGSQQALEVGTFTGYSAICIARGLPDGGRLVTLELSEEFAEIARRWFRTAEVEEKIDLRVGPAAETLSALPAQQSFDFAFIDADKPGYPEYYEGALARLRPGGLIMLDNVLLGGRVVAPATDDDSARAIATLNERLASDDRVDLAMLGIADGVTLVRKR